MKFIVRYYYSYILNETIFTYEPNFGEFTTSQEHLYIWHFDLYKLQSPVPETFEEIQQCTFSNLYNDHLHRVIIYIE